jgi:hypothetical protein
MPVVGLMEMSLRQRSGNRIANVDDIDAHTKMAKAQVI